MKEYRIILDKVGISSVVDYCDPVYSGDYLRSLFQTYEWAEVYDAGLFTFNWIYKVTVF